MLTPVLTWTYRFLIFLVTYIISSRILSVPVGLALHFPHYVVFLMVLGLDLLQIPLFHNIFKNGIPRFWFFKKLFSFLPDKDKVENSWLGKIAQPLGGIGIILIAAIPTLGGGVWSAVLIAQILQIEYRKSFLYVTFGCEIGCFAIVYGYAAIFNLIARLFHILYVF